MKVQLRILNWPCRESIEIIVEINWANSNYAATTFGTIPQLIKKKLYLTLKIKCMEKKQTNSSWRNRSKLLFLIKPNYLQINCNYLTLCAPYTLHTVAHSAAYAQYANQHFRHVLLKFHIHEWTNKWPWNLCIKPIIFINCTKFCLKLCKGFSCDLICLK